MNKKTLVLSSLAIVSFGVTLATVFATKSSVRRLGSSADTNYTLTLDATTLSDANGSGSAVVSSSNGGQVQFDYTGLTIDSGKLVFANGATLSNPRLVSGDNNYISGVQQAQLAFAEGDTGAFTLDYTWGDSLLAGTPYYQRRGYILSNSYTSYGFLGERPNFLKFSATAESTVESLTITYSCTRDGEEPSDNLVLNSATQLEQFKTVVNRGNNFAGQTVELGADIDLSTLPEGTAMSPIGYTDSLAFQGTFDGKNHTVSNYTYTGNDSIAFFSRVTNGTVKNLKLANVNLEATGSQRCSGIVARASGATIQNCEVTSGTLTAKTQCGGIAAIALGGVTIENCINRASVTGSTAGANGGILGYVYTSNATITGCKNYGAVNGSVTDLTPSGSSRTYVAFLGGIVGRIDSTGTHTISNCENYGAVSMIASTAGIGTGGIVGCNKDAATINISGCLNEGAISGKEATAGIMGQLRGAGSVTIENSINRGNVTAPSLGVAGILGATLANGSAAVSVLGSDNYGTISGTQYVGGIAGLPRKSTAASALVNCRNFGDISASSTACGGVIGLARINVTNCSCYYDATLTFKGDAKKASACNEIGVSSSAAGYITSGVQADSSNSNGAVVSGSLLINLDGTTYTA